MSEIHLPPTHMAEKMVTMRLPLGQVYVASVKTAWNVDPEPAGVRTVILPLYYANAYPSHYYAHKLVVDVETIIDFDLTLPQS